MIADILGVQKSTVKNVNQLSETLKKHFDTDSASLRAKRRSTQNAHIATCGPGLPSVPVNTSYISQRSQNTASQWVWCSFTNSARSDSLELHHWRPKCDTEYVVDKSKACVDMSEDLETHTETQRTKKDTSFVSDTGAHKQTSDYAYAACNKKADVILYTHEQYKFYLANLDAEWDKDETDYLLEMCRQFDLKFTIVYDRYDYNSVNKNTPPKPYRPLEALKNRYYSISRRMTEIEYDIRRSDLRGVFDEKIGKCAPNSQENIEILNLQMTRLLAELKDEQQRHSLIRFKYDPTADTERRIALERQYNVKDSMKNEERDVIEKIKKLETRLKKEEKTVKKDDAMKRRKKHGATLTEDDDAIPMSALQLQRRPGATTASQLLHNFSANLNKKHNVATESGLKTLRSLTGVACTQPEIYTSETVEAYAALRVAVALSINLQKRLNQLQKEKETWVTRLDAAKIANATDVQKKDGLPLVKSGVYADESAPAENCTHEDPVQGSSPQRANAKLLHQSRKKAAEDNTDQPKTKKRKSKVS